MPDMMPVVQLIITILGVFVIPGLVYYISTQIDKRLSALELNLEKRFGQIAQMNAQHVMESGMTNTNHEERLKMLEGDRKSIHERFDQIQLNIANALAQSAPEHGHGHR